jgi:hypothetical protein
MQGSRGLTLELRNIRPPAASFAATVAAWSSRESRVVDLRRGDGVHPLLHDSLRTPNFHLKWPPIGLKV